eukprot:scaffold187125_cov18-Tisochrysis_lutea.AAC.1
MLSYLCDSGSAAHYKGNSCRCPFKNASVTLETPSPINAAGAASGKPAIVRVQLRYASLSDLLAQAAAQKPHQYGQLGLANTTALELED